jgi:hypothetical protein
LTDSHLRRIEARNLLAPAIARREDQNGHILAGIAPLLKHTHAVQLRQAEIQHGGVVGFGVAKEMSLLTIRRQVDGVAGLRQSFGKLAAQIGIVFDNKNSHDDLSARGENTSVGRVHLNGETPAIFRDPGDYITVPIFCASSIWPP